MISLYDKKIMLCAAVAFLAIIGSGFFVGENFLGNFDKANKQTSLTFWERWNGDSNETPAASPTPNDLLRGDVTSDVSEMGGDLSQTYNDDIYDFSFRFPDGLRAQKFPEKSGDLILIEGIGEKVFQVFISPFDEPSSKLTPERIKGDLPDMEVISPQQIVVGDGKIPALMFNSRHQSGDTREVWFVWPSDPQPHGNYLYQISAYADLDAFLGPILETWRFK